MLIKKYAKNERSGDKRVTINTLVTWNVCSIKWRIHTFLQIVMFIRFRARGHLQAASQATSMWIKRDILAEALVAYKKVSINNSYSFFSVYPEEVRTRRRPLSLLQSAWGLEAYILHCIYLRKPCTIWIHSIEMEHAASGRQLVPRTLYRLSYWQYWHGIYRPRLI